MLHQTSNGIPYQWYLVNSNGAVFILYPGSDHSPQDIDAAMAEIRANQDVVAMRIATEDDLDELFKHEIFRQREVRPLRWFEINQDERLIRRERRKGTSPADFVQLHVLPNVDAVREANIKKWPYLKDNH